MNPPPPAPPATRRRRSASAADPLKKVTVHLHESVSDAISREVQLGAAPSQGAFIEAAVLAKLCEMRRDKVYAAYAEAAADPAFMSDMSTTAQAFDATLTDGLDT